MDTHFYPLQNAEGHGVFVDEGGVRVDGRRPVFLLAAEAQRLLTDRDPVLLLQPQLETQNRVLLRLHTVHCKMFLCIAVFSLKKKVLSLFGIRPEHQYSTPLSLKPNGSEYMEQAAAVRPCWCDAPPQRMVTLCIVCHLVLGCLPPSWIWQCPHHQKIFPLSMFPPTAFFDDKTTTTTRAT